MIRGKKADEIEIGEKKNISPDIESEPFLNESKRDLDEVWAISEEQNCITKILPVTQVEGQNYLFYGSKRGKVSFPTHCIVGPDYICSFITSFLIIGANLLWFSAAIHGSLNSYLMAIGILVGCALITAYSKTAYTDPGIVKRMTKEEFLKLPKQSEPVCRICNIYRSSGTRHCFDCDACIEDHDHHCPWTGKCIGKNNMGYFQAFVAFLFIDLMYVIVTGVSASATTGSHHHRHRHHKP